jgi:hypothetical protein
MMLLKFSSYLNVDSPFCFFPMSPTFQIFKFPYFYFIFIFIFLFFLPFHYLLLLKKKIVKTPKG